MFNLNFSGASGGSRSCPGSETYPNREARPVSSGSQSASSRADREARIL